MDIKKGNKVSLKPEQLEKVQKSVVKIIENPEKEDERLIYYLCRTDYGVDEGSECIFCNISKTNNPPNGGFYAYCKLYQKRLKSFHGKFIAQCCEECYRDLPKNIITEK